MSLVSLKELLDRRTPGPWKQDGDEVYRAGPTTEMIADSTHDNAAAIVALSNAADELVAVAQSADRYANWDLSRIVPTEECPDQRTALQLLRTHLAYLYDVLGGEGKLD